MKTINFSDAKQRVLDLLNEAAEDHSNMLMESLSDCASRGKKEACRDLVYELDTIEEICEDMKKQIENSKTVSDILRATVDQEAPYNVLFEMDDLVLAAIFDFDHKDSININYSK
jgi:hypothetical protein